MAASNLPTPVAPPGHDGHGASRVLVVDDNRDAADTLSMLLELLGHDVETVNDGEQALAEAQRWQPHAVLLDIGMPGLGGHEVCRRLREQPGGDARVIVAVTGWGQESDQRRSREAGFDLHLVKPVDPDALEQVLQRLPRRDPTPAEGPSDLRD